MVEQNEDSLDTVEIVLSKIMTHNVKMQDIINSKNCKAFIN